MISPLSGTKMPARQCNSVDLPEPLGPMIARISPRATTRLAPRSAGVAPKDSRASRASTRGSRPHRLAQSTEAGGGQLDPPQIGFEVEQAVIGEQGIDQAARPLQLGQLTHALEVRPLLRLEVTLGGATQHQREHDLHEEHRP